MRPKLKMLWWGSAASSSASGDSAQEALETRHVDVDVARVQGHPVSVDAQMRRQGRPKGGQGAPDASPRLLIIGVRPEQRRQMIARMGVASPTGQMGAGLGPPARPRDGHHFPRPLREPEAPEKVQPQRRHDLQPSSPALRRTGLGTSARR